MFLLITLLMSPILNTLKTTKTSSLLFIIFSSFKNDVISYLNIYLYRLIDIKIQFKETFKIVFMNRAGNQLMLSSLDPDTNCTILLTS